MTFYDRFPAEVLRAHYNEKLGRPLFEPAIVGDAEGLEHLDGETLDFIIANHVIEHMEDPIRFLKSVASRLKRDGCAMITAPDKRFNFDVKRPITPFSHVLDDHLHGPVRSRAAHFRDVHNRREDDPLNGRAPEKFSEFIHFHVWDADAFVAFVAETIETFKLPLALAYSRAANNETVTILRRLPGCRG